MTTRRKPIPRSDTSIWIIEDNDKYRNNLAALLKNQKGFRCDRQFSSCEGALAAIEHETPPTIALLDIGLPGMNWIDGIARIKSLAPTVQIVILTVYDDADKVFQAVCAGAAGYLLKTSPEKSIVEGIQDVLAGGSPMNSRLARLVFARFAEMKSPSTDYKLTSRELEILKQMVEGHSNKVIGAHLSLSPHTIDTHIRGIYYKLHVNSRSSAVAKAFKERLI